MAAGQAGFPVEGFVTVVRLPLSEGTLWWGPDPNGVDVVAHQAGRALVWPDPDACLQHARAQGWSLAEPEAEPQDLVTLLDFRPVAQWLHRRGQALDPHAGLNAWNLAGDLAVTLGLPWHDRSAVDDVCHSELTAACVPWVFGREQHRPRWTPYQDRRLRHRLSAALALIAAQLPSPARAAVDGQQRG